MSKDKMALDKADKNRKQYLLKKILETPIDIRNEYVKYLEKRMEDLQRWKIIMQASRDPEHFIDLIEGLDGDESWRFCEVLDGVVQNVEIENILVNFDPKQAKEKTA